MNVGLADGSVGFVSDMINLAVWQALGSINGRRREPGPKKRTPVFSADQSRSAEIELEESSPCDDRLATGVSGWLVLCAGCNSGPQTARLQGEVSFDGRPVEKGKIDFMPVDGTAGGAASAAIVNGRYEFPPKTGAAVHGRLRGAHHRLEEDREDGAEPGCSVAVRRSKWKRTSSRRSTTASPR